MNKIFKRILLVIVIVVVIASAAYANTRPPSVEVFNAKKTDVKYTFTEEGLVTGSSEHLVVANATGNIKAIHVKKDDYIKKGALIATIDPYNYLLDINVHQNNIEGYKTKISEAKNNDQNLKDSYVADLNDLKTRLLQIKADSKLSELNIDATTTALPEEELKLIDIDIEKAKQNLEYQKELEQKYKELYTQGVISLSEWQTYEQNSIEAQKSLDQLIARRQNILDEIDNLKAKFGDLKVQDLQKETIRELNDAKIKQLEAQIQSIEKNLLKNTVSDTENYYKTLINIEQLSINSAQKNINECTIVANADGYITELPIKEMPSIKNGDAVCTIRSFKSYKNIDNIEIESYVSTNDIPNIKIGDEVEIVHNTRDESIKYKGTIIKISDWAEDKQSTLGVSQSKVKVIITSNEELKTVGIGYKLDVVYTNYKQENIIEIPSSSIFKFDNKNYVFVVVDNIIKTTEVDLGFSSPTGVVIQKGLNENDVVVKDATNKLIKEGLIIKISLV